MNKQYVKLIAKPDTWFKEGTEVYNYDADYDKKQRLTLEEWNEWVKAGICCVRGIRICELGNGEVENLGYKVGEERIDGECCGIDEFDVETIITGMTG